MSVLKKWEDVSKDIDFDNILLGNGASIAIDKCFSYSTLFETSFEEGSNIADIFKNYGSNDFEFILDKVWHAYNINKRLNASEESISMTQNGYQLIRDTLIESIRKNHIEYVDTTEYFEKIHTFLKSFKNIISLNYDLIIYWSILSGNNKLGTWFKDCFSEESGKKFKNDWKDLYEPYGSAQKASLVFYPHGNLILSKNKDGVESKIKKTDKELLEEIFFRWRKNNDRPLFISEGNSEQKLNAINRSHYLNTVYYQVLPSIKENICIYGWSLSKNDSHIIKQIFNNSSIKTAAISIYRDGKTDGQVEEEKKQISSKINKFSKDIKIIFFDASSKGCWIF